MTTMEKLFEQIFDRKREIINRAKLQAYSYSQLLVSKLLIAGLTPPPSLWRNPNSQSNEFKKEELLSHLLLPYPQPTTTNRGVFYSLHNQPTSLKGKEEVETGGHGGTHESKECFNLEHGPALVSNINDSEIGSALKAPEQDVITASLQGQNATMVSDIIVDPANMESHVSKRGCNAEEDRSTPLPDFNNNDVGCLLDSVPELHQSIISPQGQKETRILSNPSASDQSLFRIQRSKSRQKALKLRKTAEKADKIHQRDTKASVVCYDGENLFTNASKQCLSHQDDESLRLGKFSGSLSRECAEVREIGECLGKEKDANPYCGRATRSRSSCDVGTHESKSKSGNSLDTADVESGKRIGSLNSFEEVPKPVQISNTSMQRVTRIKSGASGNSSTNFLNDQKECRDQTGPGSELLLCCPDTYDITSQKAKTDCLIEPEVILDGPAKFHAYCSESTLDGDGPSSKSRMIVNPKTLDFEEVEKSRLTPMVEKGPLEKGRESANSPALLGEVTFSNSSRKTSEKHSLGKEMLNRISEPWRDSYETCLEEQVVDDVQVTDETRTGKNFEEISDAVEKIQNSHVLHLKETRSSNAGEDVYIGIYHEREETGYIPNEQVQKCEGSNQMVREDVTVTPFSSSIDTANLFRVSPSRQPEANDQSTCTLDSTLCHVEENQNRASLVSEIDKGLTSSDHVLLHEKSSERDDGLVVSNAMDSASLDGKYFTSDEIRFLEQSSMQGRKLRSTALNTWPQLKRRKIDSQETKFTSADISFRIKESQNIGGSSNGRSLNSMGANLRTTLQFESSPSSHEEKATQPDVSKSPDIEMLPKILIQETGLLPGMSIEQVSSIQETGLLPGMSIEQNELGFGEKSQHRRFSPSDKDGECDSVAALSLGNGEAEDLDLSFGLNARAAGTILETNSDVIEDGFHSSCSVASLQGKHLVTGASDQTLPEFDGSIIGEEDSDNMHIVGDAFDSLDLPTNILERASLLEQLCKSAVMRSPVFRYSTTHQKVHRTPDVCQSVPNGVLEHFDPKSTLNLTNDGSKQLRAGYSSVNELNGTFHELHPDRVPSFETYYGQSLKILPTSPVSKLWGRVSSQSVSSEKNLSSNPEHTCFPIEEDPSISEEQEDKDEVEISTQEEACSASMDYSDKRNPLADITQANVNPLPSVSAAKKSRDRSSLDSVNTESNFTGIHGGVKQKLAKRYSTKRIGTDKGKKKLTLSTKTNLMGIAMESLNNKLSKPQLSRKMSLRNGGQNVSRRDSKHNNIVSNISSFVPLVQQKQAAAVITGKRDVKVKALEAAEAARRLEEKKEDERKLKKEALKLERAKLEQENLRQAELKKKKKEDDLKKKEADVAARKRLREEEEKKEKERKRRRFEGKRQQQIEQEERLRGRKAKKDLPALAINGKLNCVMGTTDALRKPQKAKVDIDKGDGKNVKKSDMVSVASKSSDVNVRKAILEGLEAFGDCRVFTEVTDTSREKSYVISPYQSSDDEEEDDEEDEISPRKHVPTWASKKSLGLVVPSQQNIDPDILFPLKTFCNVDEVSGLEVYRKSRRF